ncbi:hypothetical protein ABPG72_017759 [Tetrahymena utriculariae]
MDQLEQLLNKGNRQIFQDSFQFSQQDKTYASSLQIIDSRLEISVVLEEQSLFYWRELFSIEQFQNKLLIQFELDNLLSKTQFIIELEQFEINTNEVLIKLAEKIARLEIKSNDQQVQLEQIIKGQSNQTGVIKDLNKLIEVLKEDLLMQIESLKIDHKNEIQQLKNELQQQNKEILEIYKLMPKMFSKIIKQKELQLIKKWIGHTLVNLELIYRATVDRFEVQKVYEKCKDKSKAIMFIETNQNRRFGFYTDLLIKSYEGNYITQNPNNIFLFSLDLKQKYTSNESNCQYAFFSKDSFLAIGGGNDICLYTSQNDNNHSYVKSFSYGKKEGLSGNDLNGGTLNFTTKEVEIFEVTAI